MSEDRPYRRTANCDCRTEIAELNYIVKFFFSLWLFQVCSSVDLKLKTSLQLQISPKEDIIYLKVKSKFVSPSRQMICYFNNEQEQEDVPPGATTPTPVAWVTWGTS